MAFQKPHEHESGAVYPESYWRVAEVAINKAGNTGRVDFHGFVNSTAANANKRLTRYARTRTMTRSIRQHGQANRTFSIPGFSNC